MLTDDTTETNAEPIRERYEEYEVGSTRVAVITDPENESAWVLSNVTQRIVP
ncbi:hypothetical protein [Natronobiforma cellulositropha]|uniref:hypothetical protein n=1 Tax=Natronobiforma cellulositropha TaxID=1679076 RepID=UPI0021D5EC0A|nr:hypothetical protein [Natronobiforma cellulositropha]